MKIKAESSVSGSARRVRRAAEKLGYAHVGRSLYEIDDANVSIEQSYNPAICVAATGRYPTHPVLYSADGAAEILLTEETGLSVTVTKYD